MDATWSGIVSWGMIASGTVACVLLAAGITAPYGRYSRPGWGFMLPAKAAWLAQEIWSFAMPVALLLQTSVEQLKETMSLSKALLLIMFLVHYLNRSIIYPLRMRGGRPTPISVFALAAAFCVVNGSLQGWWLMRTPATHDDTLFSPLFWLGSIMWAAGFGLNLQADAVLRQLRRPGDSSYSIPQGGLFNLVSGANFSAEILEWVGWAIAARRLPASAFAFFTACNIAPRALHHHRWYQHTFGSQYPSGRRALIPLLW